MKLFTLAKQATDYAKILNGRIFTIEQREDGSAYLFDVEASELAFVTNKVAIWKEDDTALTIITTKGSVYRFVRVDSLLPTHRVSMIAAKPVEPIRIINSKISSKDINYSDGYWREELEFNRDITKEEFKEFVRHNLEYVIADKDDVAWFSNYTILEGSGNKWTYTLVKRYTD